MTNTLFSPPYYAVIFTSVRSEYDENYHEVSLAMLELAKQQHGFLGVDSARSEIGITVSYWRDEAAIRAWKVNADHWIAQKKGREIWYDFYSVRVAKVEREYLFEKDKIL